MPRRAVRVILPFFYVNFGLGCLLRAGLKNGRSGSKTFPTRSAIPNSGKQPEHQPRVSQQKNANIANPRRTRSAHHTRQASLPANQLRYQGWRFVRHCAWGSRPSGLLASLPRRASCKRLTRTPKIYHRPSASVCSRPPPAPPRWQLGTFVATRHTSQGFLYWYLRWRRGFCSVVRVEFHNARKTRSCPRVPALASSPARLLPVAMWE